MSTARAVPSLAPLERFLRRTPMSAQEERCELCATDLRGPHDHVVHLEKRTVLCVCRGCYLLFTHEGAAGGKYRVIPDRCVRLPGSFIDEAQWERMQIPVGIAFFFHNSAQGRTVAFYPGPAGATESQLPLGTWTDLERGHPALEALAPDVEALLVRRRPSGDHECFIAPIDACYELVGRLRRHWKGFDGGDEVRSEIDAFFRRLRQRAAGRAVERTV